MNYFLNKIKSFFGILILLFIFFPSFVIAATIFTSPSSTEVRVGDTFTVSVNLNSQGTYINASSLDLKYDSSMLSVQGIGRSSSIFTLWAEEPSNSSGSGIIHLSGGLSSPGWNGSNGNVIRVTFKAKAVGKTQITPLNGSILANDGIGTDVMTGSQSTNITIKEASPIISKPKTEKKEEPVAEEPEEVEEELSAESFVIPVIKNLPDVLIENQTLSFDGRGLPNGEVQVYIQKGKEDIEITQLSTDEDGKFYVKYKYPVSSGFYKIWAKNLSTEGVLGTSSDIYYVEVISKSYLDIFGVKISYKNLSIGLLIALIISLISLGIMFKSRSKNIIVNKKPRKNIRNIIKDIGI